MSSRALKVAVGFAVAGAAAGLLYGALREDGRHGPRPVAIWSAPNGRMFEQFRTSGDASCQFTALACGERWFRSHVLVDPSSADGRALGRRLRLEVADFLDRAIHDPAEEFLLWINYMRPGVNGRGVNVSGLDHAQLLAFAQEYVGRLRQYQYGDEVTMNAFGRLYNCHVNSYDVDLNNPGALRNNNETASSRPYALINTNNERGSTRTFGCHFELLLPSPPALPGTASRGRP